MKKYINPSVKVKDVRLTLLISNSPNNSLPTNDDPLNQYAKDIIEFVGNDGENESEE